MNIELKIKLLEKNDRKKSRMLSLFEELNDDELGFCISVNVYMKKLLLVEDVFMCSAKNDVIELLEESLEIRESYELVNVVKLKNQLLTL